MHAAQLEIPGLPPSRETERAARKRGAGQATARATRIPASPTAAPAVASATPPPTIITSWVKIPQPDGSFILKPGRPVVASEEIGTAEAARILGLSRDHVARICDEGKLLLEGVDWRKLPPKPGTIRGGNYHIKRASIIRLAGLQQDGPV